ncbi:histone-lysine N-methyltransferase PRDM9-like [Galendromus occidentalis]|uniref:Histone-lysine N-methyltransferase PRDM9-like n=1 Tax=Galendromus occidentalis TaxID=34638 RepID=A0AAJ7WI35_9ACAR|nr:histone-lysine N-methyltransferase PRDM9-like [Galendromus occidentalis]
MKTRQRNALVEVPQVSEGNHVEVEKVYTDLSAVSNYEVVAEAVIDECGEVGDEHMPEVQYQEDEEDMLEDDEPDDRLEDPESVDDPELTFETSQMPRVIIRQADADVKSVRSKTRSPPLKRVTRGKKNKLPKEIIYVPSDDDDEDLSSSEDEWQPPQADEADAKWAFEQVRSMVDRAMTNAAEKLRSEMEEDPKRKFGTRVLAKSRGVKQIVTVVRDKVIENPAAGPRDLRTDRVIPDFLEFHRFRAKGYGVLAKLPIDIGVRFGPYAGVIRKMKNVNNESGYAWQLRGFKEGETVVDGFDVKHANWLRYVNCSNSAEEANLRVFQHEKRIYYKTCKPIVPGDELLVWYGKEYRKVINSQIESKKRKKMETVESTAMKTYKCPHCSSKMLVKSTFDRHVKKCGKNPDLPKTLKCEVPGCGFFTVHQAMMDRHLANPKHVNVTVHRCRWKCGYRTFNELRYRLHLERRHKNMEFPDSYDIECKVCGQRFPSKNAMDIHSQWHRKNLFFCNVCGKGYTTIGILKEHAQMHEGKNFKCEYKGCGYATYCKRTLNRHTRCVHLKIRTAFCDLCSKSFFCKKDLRQHQNKLHNVFKVEKIYKCRPHKASYNTAEELKQHREEMLASVKPKYKYQCEVCCYSTAYPTTYKTHMSCHTEERKFACDQCEKTFKLSVSLKEHLMTHENADPDRFACLFCGKRCRTSVELRSHKRRCKKGEEEADQNEEEAEQGEEDAGQEGGGAGPEEEQENGQGDIEIIEGVKTDDEEAGFEDHEGAIVNEAD